MSKLYVFLAGYVVGVFVTAICVAENWRGFSL